MTTTVSDTKISEVENEIPDHSRCIITYEFTMLTAKKVAARLKHANLVSKTDFNNKLISFNSKITSNKKKLLGSSKKTTYSNNKRL